MYVLFGYVLYRSLFTFIKYIDLSFHIRTINRKENTDIVNLTLVKVTLASSEFRGKLNLVMLGFITVSNC